MLAVDGKYANSPLKNPLPSPGGEIRAELRSGRVTGHGQHPPHRHVGNSRLFELGADRLEAGSGVEAHRVLLGV